MNGAPKLASVETGEQLRLVASGEWTGAHGHELELVIANAQPALAKSRQAAIDLSGVSGFDTFGAWLLERMLRDRGSAGAPLQVEGLPPAFARLAAQMAGTNRSDTLPLRPSNPLLSAIADVGRTASGIAGDAVNFANMLGAVGMAAARVVVRPSRFRLISTVHQLDRVGWQAVPIISLITVLIGGIIAQQGFFHFRRFGAEIYAVDMTGILVLREIGVLIVAIMVAGRSGSSYTAELGSMKMREEIDALSTMGFDPVEVLVLPRVVALVLALPMLAFLGAMAALLGGGLMASAYGGMSPAAFVARLREAISLTHFEVGMIKAPFMALVIGIVAAMEGFNVGGSAESLGLRTTASVVKSIFLVIVLDGLFAIFFASIGM